MERTPEEIKRSLECSAAQADGRCEEYAACACCPLFVEENVSMEDIAAYIRQLEMLAKPNEQIRWERDVAVDQLRQLGVGFGEKVEAQVPKWISVEERLPEEHERVLVAIQLGDGLSIHTTGFAGGAWLVTLGACEHVTHWMPLPPAPKEG